ncbi:hypothetical protein HanRHA438_Chr11g0494991 [Helianthus annuus]|uniref:Uncharacterized protein n=1 Tax=Helianthus annuus TaxID=4232 RepID=A0A9K3HMP1_HELAN|nr:hypothetical protein HanXRQr2_Chr11g0481951 [Helianthus annuus]KAJ0500936.1 hypothetical protein HanHA300_Chr11g0394971 [Helianthus annuus]KAJ0508589.1 hypothetical protein HanIR_Chr11g0518911 [Helianthus annuus]KAJ0516828.1 hypothetical protein HanHA89_Chr11g0418171 [Helianthus annuus]KAJ0684833.1 hypothetical protein HanLR1_Chr11g0395601 [Helianthus annuus]
MEGKQERPQNISFEPRKLQLQETKKQQMPMSGHTGVTTTRCYAEIAHLASPRGHTDSKPNCLCSPTTHVGSFRCRYHRASSLANHGGSFNHLPNFDTKTKTEL